MKRIFGIILSLICFFISLILIYLIFTYNSENILLSYNMSNNINYRLYPTDNSFYDEEYLTNINNYPISFIKNIGVDFTNAITFNKNVDIDYDYSIVAKINVTDSNKQTDNVIYTKEYELLNEKNLKSTKLKNEILKSVDIDYKFYNDVVNKYKLNIRMPVEANLEVIMNINYNNKLINKNEKLILSMPLSVNTINIYKNYKENYDENVISEFENRNIYIAFAAILLVISIIVLIFCLNHTFSDDNSYKKYKLNKILKYYEQIIVEVSNTPNIDKNSIIRIENFKDMIDLNRQLNKPIMYYNNGYEEYGIFLIKSDDITYIYEINEKREKI